MHKDSMKDSIIVNNLLGQRQDPRMSLKNTDL